MNNNVNTSGNNPSGQSGANGDVNDNELDSRIISNFFLLNEFMRDEVKKLNDQVKKLKFENVKLKIDNRILDIDKANLEKKYEGASNALKQALQKIKDLRNDPNKKINPIQVSVEQNNRFSLLGKIKSFKDNLQSHRAVDYSCINNNDNQQTK